MGNLFSISQQGVADYNQRFLDALEFVDDLIQSRNHLKSSVWRSMVSRAPYKLGEGLVKKSYRFHPGVGDQRGLQEWRAIQISRAAGEQDEGYDACSYQPSLVDYGFQTVNYTGFQTERRTKHICLRDIRFVWQFNQQLGLIMNFLSDITNSVWENASREQYMKFAVDGSHSYVLSEGRPTSVAFGYDPFTTDSDLDNVLTLDSNTKISTINWSYMRRFSRHLEMQAPLAAIGSDDGKPLFGLVMDLEDIDRMIEEDDKLREDFRYFSPKVLIQNYGKVTSFKGYTLMHDGFAPRFTLKSDDGTTMTLKRVDPLAEVATTIGNRVDVSSDYENAEYGIGIIYMKDVYKFEVPPAGPVAPGGGTHFGASPSLNGEFEWINIRNEEHNLLGENGFYFSRYEYFPKPLAHDEDAHIFLYRRCPQSEVTDCDIGGTDAVSSPVAGSGLAVAVSGSDVLFTLSAASILEIEPPVAVSIQVDDGTSYTCAIADASGAPDYVFCAQTAADALLVIAGTTFIISW